MWIKGNIHEFCNILPRATSASRFHRSNMFLSQETFTEVAFYLIATFHFNSCLECLGITCPEWEDEQDIISSPWSCSKSTSSHCYHWFFLTAFLIYHISCLHIIIYKYINKSVSVSTDLVSVSDSRKHPNNFHFHCYRLRFFFVSKLKSFKFVSIMLGLWEYFWSLIFLKWSPKSKMAAENVRW